jgi:hypothetical protein
MGRANKQIKSGDWLNKDELIRTRVPLAIVDIVFDRVGTSQFPGENWILSFEPWDNDKFPGPTGNVRFKNLPTRQGQFEDIDAQLEEAKAQNVGYIGPVAMVSGISAAKNRYKTLADVMVDEAGELMLDARGFPRIDGEAEPEPPAAAPVPTGPRRPSGTTKAQSTGQQERTQATQAAEKPATAPVDVPAATVPDNTAPAPKRRGRPASQPAPLPPGTPREVAQHEAQQQAEASAEPITVPPAQPQVTQTVPMATALCPHCNVEIGPNRVYPAAGGGFVIMHAHCPVKQDTVILPVQMEES